MTAVPCSGFILRWRQWHFKSCFLKSTGQIPDCLRTILITAGCKMWHGWGCLTSSPDPPLLKKSVFKAGSFKCFVFYNRLFIWKTLQLYHDRSTLCGQMIGLTCGFKGEEFPDYQTSKTWPDVTSAHNYCPATHHLPSRKRSKLNPFHHGAVQSLRNSNPFICAEGWVMRKVHVPKGWWVSCWMVTNMRAALARYFPSPWLLKTSPSNSQITGSLKLLQLIGLLWILGLNYLMWFLPRIDKLGWS